MFFDYIDQMSCLRKEAIEKWRSPTNKWMKTRAENYSDVSMRSPSAKWQEEVAAGIENRYSVLETTRLDV